MGQVPADARSALGFMSGPWAAVTELSGELRPYFSLTDLESKLLILLGARHSATTD